jgi:hypothetical protein
MILTMEILCHLRTVCSSAILSITKNSYVLASDQTEVTGADIHLFILYRVYTLFYTGSTHYFRILVSSYIIYFIKSSIIFFVSMHYTDLNHAIFATDSCVISRDTAVCASSAQHCQPLWQQLHLPRYTISSHKELYTL